MHHVTVHELITKCPHCYMIHESTRTYIVDSQTYLSKLQSCTDKKNTQIYALIYDLQNVEHLCNVGCYFKVIFLNKK